jgi:hypothetical protein
VTFRHSTETLNRVKPVQSPAIPRARQLIVLFTLTAAYVAAPLVTAEVTPNTCAPATAHNKPGNKGAPTDADVFRCRAFLEPLVPVGGKTTPEENIALQKAIESSAAREDQDDYTAILTFLERYPKSPWRAALLTNLGLAYRHTGWFLKALSAWEEAWGLSKSETGSLGKGLADRAFGELVELNARLGRRERVEALLKQIEGRQLTGVAVRWGMILSPSAMMNSAG